MSDAIVDIPKCVICDIGLQITGEDAPSIVASMNEYLSRFAAPIHGEGITTYRCLKCDLGLSGMLGTFQWGIASGEGECSHCGWPCRAHHYPKHGADDIFDGALQVILQYHPDHVTINQSEDGKT